MAATATKVSSKQLKMIYPRTKLASPRVVDIAPGYKMRFYNEDDEEAYISLMRLAGFEKWSSKSTEECFKTVLEGGWFMIVHKATEKLVATAMAMHFPTPDLRCGGILGWVAADPEHKGKRLGITVCAAVTRRLVEAGYKNISLATDDWRLPAVLTYLRLGYQPYLFDHDMDERWATVCQKLNWPIQREDWIHPMV